MRAARVRRAQQLTNASASIRRRHRDISAASYTATEDSGVSEARSDQSNSETGATNSTSHKRHKPIVFASSDTDDSSNARGSDRQYSTATHPPRHRNSSERHAYSERCNSGSVINVRGCRRKSTDNSLLTRKSTIPIRTR